jgi:hypothetical protein
MIRHAARVTGPEHDGDLPDDSAPSAPPEDDTGAEGAEEPDGDGGQWVDAGGYRTYQPAPPAPPAPREPPLPPPAPAWPAAPGAGAWGAAPDGSGPPAAPGTDGMAIAALVTGLLGPLGLLFGVLAHQRIRRSGRGGSGLATAGIVLGGLWLAFLALGVIGILIGTTSSEAPTPQATASQAVPVDEVRIGQCFPPIEDGIVVKVAVVPCSSPHESEAFAQFSMPKGRYPGERPILIEANDGCTKRLSSYVGAERASSGAFELLYLYPREANWRIGDRQISCLLIASDGKLLTRSHRKP